MVDDHYLMPFEWNSKMAMINTAPELTEYLQMYQCELNVAMFYGKSGLRFHGSILAIKIFLYAEFIDFRCIFMWK